MLVCLDRIGRLERTAYTEHKCHRLVLGRCTTYVSPARFLCTKANTFVFLNLQRSQACAVRSRPDLALFLITVIAVPGNGRQTNCASLSRRLDISGRSDWHTKADIGKGRLLTGILGLPISLLAEYSPCDQQVNFVRHRVQ